MGSVPSTTSDTVGVSLAEAKESQINVKDLSNAEDIAFEQTNQSNSLETDTKTVLGEIAISNFKDKTFERLKKISEKFADLKIICGQSIAEETISEIQYVHNTIYGPQNATRLELQNFRKDVAEFMISIKLFDIFTTIIADYKVEDDFSGHFDTYTHLCFLLNAIIFNYTDASDAMAEKVATTRVLETCKKVLDTYRKSHIEKKLSQEWDEFVYTCHGVVHNVSMREKNVEPLRKLNFIKVLQPYLKSHNDRIKLSCLTTLANIVNEEECDIIKTNIRIVSRLLEVMENGIYEGDRIFEGWQCKECALVVRKLARNDANKQILWTLGAIPLLVKFANYSDEDEQLEAVLAIWSLAFDKQIREDMTTNEDLEVVELLLGLKKSTGNTELKTACERCLWTLREELKNSPFEHYRKAVEEIQWRPSSERTEDKEGHIMISYQSAHRAILMKIKDKLKEHSFKVWMDVDEMGGSTLQSMANAIENAAVVLLCYSRNYHDSQYCQSEAEYAYNQKKPIVPLKMEQGYKPDGWLGILLGEKYFVEFSGKYEFDSKFKTLIREIKNAMKIKEVNRPMSSVPRTNVNTAQQMKDEDDAGVLGNIFQIRNWTNVDVSNWLKKHKLDNQGLDELTGEEISLLAKMQVEAPEHMYRCIRKELKLKNLLVKSRLVWALYGITKRMNSPS